MSNGNKVANLHNLPNELVCKIISEVRMPRDHLALSKSCFSMYTTYKAQDIHRLNTINMGFALPEIYTKPKAGLVDDPLPWNSILGKVLSHSRNCREKLCLFYSAKPLPKEHQLKIGDLPEVKFNAFTGDRQLHNFIESLGNSCFRRFICCDFRLISQRSAYSQQPATLANERLLHNAICEGWNLNNDEEDDYFKSKDDDFTFLDYYNLASDPEKQSQNDDSAYSLFDYFAEQDYNDLFDHPIISCSHVCYPPTNKLWLSFEIIYNNVNFGDRILVTNTSSVTVLDVVIKVYRLMTKSVRESTKHQLSYNMYLSGYSGTSEKIEKLVKSLKINLNLFEVDLESVLQDRPTRSNFIKIQLLRNIPDNVPLLKFTSMWV